MRIINVIIALICISIPFSLNAQEISIGVLAKRGTDKVEQQWQPTADYLGEELAPLKFKIIPLNFDEIFQAVENNRVDFILANPFYYVSLEMKFGVSRIATMRNRLRDRKDSTQFGGVLFTLKENSSLNTIEDMKGKSLGAVDKYSFGGWHVAWYEMKQHGLDPFSDLKSITFEGTHDGVVFAVLDHIVDIGTVRTDTLERMAQEGAIDLQRFKIIHPQQTEEFPLFLSTKLYPEWPFARLPQTSNELAHRVAIALMQMPENSLAAREGKISGWTIPADYQPVHSCLKALQVGPYAFAGRISVYAVFEQYWHWLLTVLFLFTIALIVAFIFARLNARLRSNQNEIRKLNATLETRVTERTQELLMSEQKYKDLYDSSPDMYVSVDTQNTKILDCNQTLCDKLEYSREALIGRPVFDIYTPASMEEARKSFYIINTTGNVNETHLQLQKQDGSTVDVLLYATAIKDETGKIIRSRSCMIDITRLKKAEEELLRLNESLEEKVRIEVEKRSENEIQILQQARIAQMGDMITNISHHWRQPLNIIGLNVQELWDAQQYGDLTKEHFEEIITKTMKTLTDMSETLDRFREFTTSEPNKSNFQLADVILRVIDLMHPELESHFIQVITNLDESLIYYGDQNAFEQILYNILINAQDVMTERKRDRREISLNLKKIDRDRINVIISDTGGGIDQNILSRIFDPFFTTKEIARRTGLGLFFAKNLTETELGGRLDVTSNDRGATFTITLTSSIEMSDNSTEPSKNKTG